MKLIKFKLSDFLLTSIDDISRTVWVGGQGEEGSEEGSEAVRRVSCSNRSAHCALGLYYLF